MKTDKYEIVWQFFFKRVVEHDGKFYPMNCKFSWKSLSFNWCLYYKTIDRGSKLLFIPIKFDYIDKAIEFVKSAKRRNV